MHPAGIGDGPIPAFLNRRFDMSIEMDTRRFHCQDTEITMGLLIDLEKVIDIKLITSLMEGAAIEITFDQQFRIMELITDLSSVEIAKLTAEEVAIELGFFTARLALQSQRGRALSAILPFLVMKSGEISELLERFSQLYPSLAADLITILSEAQQHLKPSTGISVP
jgi:hypothetical protein